MLMSYVCKILSLLVFDKLQLVYVKTKSDKLILITKIFDAYTFLHYIYNLIAWKYL